MYNPLETLHVGDQERERVSGTGGGGDFGGLQVRVTFHGWSMDKKDFILGSTDIYSSLKAL